MPQTFFRPAICCRVARSSPAVAISGNVGALCRARVLPSLRSFLSNGRLISVDEQTIAFATIIAARASFMQARAMARLARRWHFLIHANSLVEDKEFTNAPADGPNNHHRQKAARAPQ
jgi:hypothetical protein